VGKNKLKRFAENETFKILVQPEFDDIFNNDHQLKGQWHSNFFGNTSPIVLELGCGRGEYTVALGNKYPSKNFIGIDIKGARLWRGAKTAVEEQMSNIGFIRTRIEFISSFFGSGEVSEIWVTFPDPQLKKSRLKKRLTCSGFLNTYRQFLAPGGIVHLKTDNQNLHFYTKKLLEENGMEILFATNDLYNSDIVDDILSVKTKYEQEYLAKGMPITYLKFKIDGQKPLVEPADIEPFVI
jgi:tRNA (guanine-N(7)-)-methyltransferase